MSPASLRADIRDLLDDFTERLTKLVTAAALEAVEAGVGARKHAGAQVPRGSRSNGGPAAVIAPVRKRSGGIRQVAPVSFDLYERLALERALDECNGETLAAGQLLGLGKSTMYRKVNHLGVRPHVAREFSETQLRAMRVPTNEPVSLDNYERAAVKRALEECKGDAVTAARLMKVGKSTFYRRMRYFEIPTDGVTGRKSVTDNASAAGRRASTQGSSRRANAQRETKALLDYVLEHPGIRGEQVYAALQRDPRKLGARMRALVAEGKVRTVGERRGMAYYAV